ncbi:MAG: serine--tRNA ligase [Proteobacteria bacterium]|nr:serine--tRNA ligase [Pseudomonadota bacterium]
MIDLLFARDNKEHFIQLLLQRGESLDVLERFFDLDFQLKTERKDLQDLQEKRNHIAKEIEVLKKSYQDSADAIKKAESIRAQMQIQADKVRDLEESFNKIFFMIPNLQSPDVPIGKSDADNVLEYESGKLPNFDFKPLQHFEVSAVKQLMNFEQATKIAGSRFVVLESKLAKLERALISFMLDHNTEEFGYKEVSPPCLVNQRAIFATGQFPKLEDDLFQTKDGFYLAPTAEVMLTNLVFEKNLLESDLPLRLTASTPCFRLEAGSSGKDIKGMIRQHQFEKVELVSIVKPSDSEGELLRMRGVAESILKSLELPYRVMLLCGYDMGFSASKTYDIEVWMPGQNRYREISSCSNCTDFQMRRMRVKYKDVKSQKYHPHSLNGSALAVGRTMAAIIENYQTKDGSIKIPYALQKYMGGKTIIDSA